MDRLMALQFQSQFLQVKRRRSWPREQVEKHQARSLRRLRAYAYAHSPFYRKFHGGLTERPLEELPVLTKAVMMEHFEELVTDPAVRRADLRAYAASLQGEERFLGRYWVITTSGSSGLQGFFLHDRSELVTLLASFARLPIESDSRKRRKTVMITSTEPLAMQVRMGALARSEGWPVLNLDTREPLEGLVERLNAWQPEMLTTFASMAGVLAEEQRAGRLRIAPTVIVCSGEVLAEKTRRRIEAAWSRRPFNVYGSVESGQLATECGEHRGLHLFDDQVIVEVVDGDNRPVPPGVYGEKVLITVLFRRTQPLIRYELSDMVRLAAEPCSCGLSYPLIDGLQGRVWEVLYFPTPTGGEVAVQPALLDEIMEPVPAEWQVVQEPAGLRVLLGSVREQVNEELLVDEIRRALAAQGAVVPPVQIQRVAAIPRSAGGKAPLIRSTVPRDLRQG